MRLDKLAADRKRCSTQLDLLVEHRQALITAAVTGELRVPGVAVVMSGPLETDFESTICSWLVDDGGYVGPVKVGNAQGDPRDFDAVRGLDTAELFAFIGATQADVWEQLVTRYGGDRDAAQAKFVGPVGEGA